jgi:hypothetical protein
MLNVDLGVGCSSGDYCGNSKSADFCIKRHDTRPSLRISVSDCDGAIDLTDENLFLEASMWFEAKLKSKLDIGDSTISLADNIGFDQISVGDVVFLNNVRNPEQLTVLSIDEVAKLIYVSRAQNATTEQNWQKGSTLKIFRFLEQQAHIESVFEEKKNIDETISEELVDTFFVFDWSENQTSLPGYYFIEFRLIKISENNEIEWQKRFPLEKNGFLINIIDSSTPKI